MRTLLKCMGGSPGRYGEVNCTHIAYTCGLCASCYTRTNKAIRDGKANLEDLVAQGRMVAPVQRNRRKLVENV